MEIFEAVVALLVGLVIGSFLNVVIWRLPRGDNLSRPRSSCPGCGAFIRWYDNIPLVSWVLLRARCRACGTSISSRYPMVEILTGLLFLLAYMEHGPHLPTTAMVAVFLAGLVAISFIDIDHRIIPDKISKPGMVLFIALAPLSVLPDPTFINDGVKPALNQWLFAAAGCAVGAGVVYAIRLIGSWILKKEAMGMGDVKLLGFIGALVGPLQALYALALACLAGAVIGGFMFVIGKRRPMPCELEAKGDGFEASFRRVRVRGDRLLVRGAPVAEQGKKVRLELVLPATRILEEEDARLSLKGRISAVHAAGESASWEIEVRDMSANDRDLLAFFAQSYRYIPFGPFLAVGGAATALFGRHVHWFMTEGYPEFARSLIVGGC